jgi:hypothetical protein
MVRQNSQHSDQDDGSRDGGTIQMDQSSSQEFQACNDCGRSAPHCRCQRRGCVIIEQMLGYDAHGRRFGPITLAEREGGC